LAAIDSGFILDADPQAQAGNSLTPAGDVNGDGIDDFLVGAPSKNSGNGAAYLVYGSKNIGVNDEFLSLDQLNSNEGVILLGANQERAGTAIEPIDLNQDGQAEFLAVGAPSDPTNSQAAPGKIYIIPKGNLVGQTQVNLASAASLTLTTSTNNGTGSSLATGDVNDDNVTDLIVSAPGQNQVYVVLGQALQNNTGTLSLENLGSNGLLLTATEGEVGTAIDTADVNQDNIPDIIIGAPQTNPVVDNYQTTRGYGGQVYVVYGSKNLPIGNSINLDQLNGNNGSVLVGQGEYNPPGGENSDLPPDFADFDSAGLSVSSAGDVNGDGYEDLLIGAPTGSPGGISTLGRAYLVFGKSGGFGTRFNLNQLDGTNGIELIGVANADGSKGGAAGISVQKAGDLNGDKIDDLLVGAPLLNTTQDNANNGQAYAIFGTNNWQPFLENGTLNLSSICTNTRVFTFNNPAVNAQLGTAVSSAGDINQDSFPDIVLGSLNTGQVYVAFGHPWFGPGGSLDAQKLRSDNGFAFSLPTGNSQLGTVNGGGDINGDGYTELLVADNGPQNAGGQLFHLFFGSDPLKPNPNANHVTISTVGIGFVLGRQTLAQGDFNGDTLTDFVVGTTSSTNNRLATIVFGSTNQTVWSKAPLQDLDALQQDNGGISFTLNETNRQFTNVSTGDFNGDGYEDLLLSGDTLRPFVVFGQGWSPGQVQTIDAESTLDGTHGFVFRSEYNSTSNTGLGDVNGDGIEDLAIMTDQRQGTIGYVVFGGSQIGSSGVVNLDFLNGSNGFLITRDDSQPVGYTVNSAGDLNSDGYADIVIGQTPLDNTGLPPSGEARAQVIYGGPKFSSSFDISTDLDGVKGFSVKNSQTSDENSGFGTAVSGVGDTNADGYGDLLIGSPGEGANSSFKGNSYLLFGARELGNTGGVIDVAQLNGSNGFAIAGAESDSFSGTYLSGTGDMNGDGFSDFSVGARGSFNSTTGTSVGGVAFVPFGGDYSGSVNYLGDANDNVLRAVEKATINSPHVMNGRQGNDILMSVGVDGNAGGQNQVFMLGGDGDDILAIGDLSFGYIDGGSGTDTLKLNEFLFASESVDLTLPSVRGRIKN
ncbi:MAG: Calx-beta domain-containing protein, partial [Microcystaceae cyanobacterium]